MTREELWGGSSLEIKLCSKSIQTTCFPSHSLFSVVVFNEVQTELIYVRINIVLPI